MSLERSLVLPCAHLGKRLARAGRSCERKTCANPAEGRHGRGRSRSSARDRVRREKSRASLGWRRLTGVRRCRVEGDRWLAGGNWKPAWRRLGYEREQAYLRASRNAAGVAHLARPKIGRAAGRISGWLAARGVSAWIDARPSVEASTDRVRRTAVVDLVRPAALGARLFQRFREAPASRPAEQRHGPPSRGRGAVLQLTPINLTGQPVSSAIVIPR
jgi:hypothetical protein